MTKPSDGKIDFSKTHKDLYTASSSKIKQVEAGPAVFLSVKGQGEPGGTVFQSAVEKLYSLAYTAKFAVMKPKNVEFKVSNLECLWLSDPENTPMNQWKWQLLVRIPEVLSGSDLEKAREDVSKKRQLQTQDVERIAWEEGAALQVMHIGPYDKVGETYHMLASFAVQNGFEPQFPGHEIYISDPRRVAPEKLKTIVRLPVKAR